MCLGVGLCLQKTTARVHGDAIMEMNNKKKKREIPGLMILVRVLEEERG